MCDANFETKKTNDLLQTDIHHAQLNAKEK